MATMDELVKQVQDLEGATTDLLEATNVSKQSLDTAVSSASTDASRAEVAESKATPAATQAKTAQTAAEKARDDAAAIAYEGDASVTPAAGNIPIADSNAKIDHGWLPDRAVPAPDFHLPLISDLRIQEGFGDPDHIDVSAAQDGSIMVDLPTRSADFSRATTKTYINKSEELTTAGIDEPAFEKNGILIEGSSTNYVTYSNSVDNYPEYRVNTAAIQESISTKGGIRFTSTGSIATKWGSFLSNSLSGDGFVMNTGSFCLRGNLDNISSILFLYTPLGGGVDKVEAKLSPPFMEDVRYSISAESSFNEGWQRPEIRVNLNPETPSGQYVEFYNMQIEPLPFASSYIPTNGTSVTRAKETLSIKTGANLSKSDVVTINAYWDIGGTISNTSNYVIYAGQSSPQNPIAMGIVRDQYLYRHGGSSNYYSRNEANSGHLAMSYTKTKLKLYVNGEFADEESEAESAVLEDIFYVGGRHAGGHSIYGHIRDFRIWHKALTDEQISALGAV